ncbi:hypothetical protein [Aquimarina aquimarini]|uniref:hypothetical protein n=1 Tax=Aquimarina aquimarini TaxID=1191734 RepID=UPI000D54FA69|nr:hypothetical protein [Aquimarina aquimarini]
MKNRIIAFASVLITTAFMLSCSSDDDNTSTAPDGVITATKYKDIKSANREINAVVQGAFNTQPTPASKSSYINKTTDCTTIDGMDAGTGGNVTIDFGTNCSLPDGETVSGKIIISFSIKEEATGVRIDMNYSLENFSFNGITVSGNSVATISANLESDQYFTSTSDYVFTWDDGLKVTSKDVTSTEVILNQETFEYHTLVHLDTKAEFNNGDVYTSKTTAPLRIENGCEYVVSGTIVTNENAATTTLDYGDGTCDKIANQTDSDGNTTTIDLSVEENFTL